MDKSLVYKTIGMILATVLPVVLFLYFRTNNGFQQNNMLPHAWWPISVDSIEENGKWKYDTVFHKIPHFKYVSSSGQIVTDSDMIGKISVVNFFFAQCPSICPIMNSNMANVIQSVSASNNLRVFSFTIDPDRDSLAALAEYSNKYNTGKITWHFLRGQQDSTFQLGRNGFKIPVDNTDSETDFLHSDRMILVDAKKQVRGYYLGTDSSDMSRLKNDLVLMLDDLENPKKRRKR